MSNNTFIEENKQALIDEMASHLNDMHSCITNLIQGEVSENSAVNNELLYKDIIGISQSLGYTIACFNQYYIFLTGEVKKESQPIGFGAMLDIKEKD